MGQVLNFNVGAARAYAESQFGGPTTENQTAPTVVAFPSTPTILCDVDGDRVGLVLQNIGIHDCFVGIDIGLVSAQAGIFLAANGGVVSMNVRDDFTMPTRRWYGQAVVAGITGVLVLEEKRVSTGILSETGPQ